MEPKFLPHFEKPETETSSFPEEMYAVSGFLSPNSKHYEKSRRFDTDIRNITEKIIPLRNTWWKSIDSSKISQAFQSSTESIQIAAIHALQPLDQDQKIELLKESAALILTHQNLFEATTEDIRDSYLTGKAGDFFVETALSSDIATSQKIQLIENLYDGPSIVSTLENPTLDERIIATAIHQISKLSSEQIVHYIEKFIHSDFDLIQAAVIEELRHLPPSSNRPTFVREALHSESPLIQSAALGQIEYLPPQERRVHIEQALLSSDEKIHCIAIDQMMGHFSKEEVVRQIENAFHSHVPLLQKKALEYLGLLDAEKQQLFAQQVFETQDEDLLVALSKEISTLDPNGVRRRIIEQGLLLPSTRMHWFFAHQIKHLPEEERLQMLQDKRFTTALITSPLYKNSPLSSENFGRDTFEKSGSKTTLLGGKLQNKLIIRHIAPDTFVAWQKAFEAHTTWKELGFDYVPIEPIQSYHLSQSGFVDVASGVLDIDYDSWQRRFPALFTNSLKDRKDAILKGLQLLGVDHGHSHNNNFVLRFFRNEDGLPDIKKAPRLYIIDFDNAESTSGN